MGSLAGWGRGATFRRRAVSATPAAITDPGIFTAEQRAISQLAEAAAERGEAIAGLGRGVAGLAEPIVRRSRMLALRREKRNTELAKADFETMKAATATARNEFLRSLRTTDADYNQINKMWADFKKKTFKAIGNTTRQKEAQKAYGEYIGAIIPRWDQDIDNIAWAVSVPRAKVKLFNAGIGILRTEPDFNIGLLKAGTAIEESNLLTAEEKDLMLARIVIETNPQWYLDNVDAEATKELFNLLSADQKRALETQARSEINRIRTEQQRATKALNDETRKTAAELWRKNALTSNWLEANRASMAASDYERYNNHLIRKAEAEKAFQANLAKIEDPYNREIFGKLDAANTTEELDALQDTVNDYASIEQKKLSVADAKKWTGEIDAKRNELIVTKADSYPEWSRLMDRITEVQAGTADIEVIRREIDRAVVPPEGQEAKITPELAISLRTRLEGIEKNPAVKKRPSLTRAHSALGRLRTQEISILPPPTERIKEDLPKIVEIENRYAGLGAELDEYADTIAGEKDFDDKINKKLQILIRQVIEEITLSWWEGWFRRGPELISERIDTLREQAVFERFTEAQQQQAIDLIEGGATVEEAVTEVETPVPRPKTQAEFDALPSGTIFIDTDGVRVRKK